MNQTPLLLKYKVRNCYESTESDIDMNSNVDDWFGGDWTDYENPIFEVWQLQLPNGNFINNDCGNIQHFRKFEYCAVGDPIPAVITFDRCSADDAVNDTIQIYQLTNNYDTYDRHWYHPNIRRALHEYERHHGDWRPCILIEE